jgi:hypothetical protein
VLYLSTTLRPRSAAVPIMLDAIGIVLNSNSPHFQKIAPQESHRVLIVVVITVMTRRSAGIDRLVKEVLCSRRSHQNYQEANSKLPPVTLLREPPSHEHGGYK